MQMEKADIVWELDELEEVEEVTIIYACESGSRAWGFPSATSDYDVRFIYVRPLSWYLSVKVENKRDVIERRMGDLDMVGWDLRKVLRLLDRNPTLLEWLNSPVVYDSHAYIEAGLSTLASQIFNPVASLHHYYGMAANTYKNYLQGDEVKIKKYFYALRPLLAVKWLEANLTPVPVPFESLLVSIEDKPELLKEVRLLLKKKKEGAELDLSPKIPVIQDWIEQELERLKERPFGKYAKELGGHASKVDAFFRNVVTNIWMAKLGLGV